MKKIRKGDLVVILTGKDKGKQGVVAQLLPDSSKVIVSGINLVKKCVKPNPLKGTEGGMITKEMPIHISNVAIYDQKANKASRVGFSSENGKKSRFLKHSSQPLA